MSDDPTRWRGHQDSYVYGDERNRFRAGGDDYERRGPDQDQYTQRAERDYVRNAYGRGGREDLWPAGRDPYRRNDERGYGLEGRRRGPDDPGRRNDERFYRDEDYGPSWDFGSRHYGADRFGMPGMEEADPRRSFGAGYGGERDYRGRVGQAGYEQGFVQGRRPYRERDWGDRASDEVSSWFGDEHAGRRRREDERQTEYRGRGPRGYTRSDDRIREDVSDRLTDDPYVDASDVEVTVSAGEVTLSGAVDHRQTKRRAEDVADRVSGVTHVQNNLRIRQQGTTGRGPSEFGGPSVSGAASTTGMAGKF